MIRPRQLSALFAVVALPCWLGLTIASVSTAAAAPAAADGGEPAPAGLTAFVDLKCSLCHAIESQGIERKSKSEKTRGPDLSTIGVSHEAAWFVQFLRKEVENADGKKHEKEFKGTPEQLEQISQFLASLKSK